MDRVFSLEEILLMNEEELLKHNTPQTLIQLASILFTRDKDSAKDILNRQNIVNADILDIAINKFILVPEHNLEIFKIIDIGTSIMPVSIAYLLQDLHAVGNSNLCALSRKGCPIAKRKLDVLNAKHAFIERELANITCNFSDFLSIMAK